MEKIELYDEVLLENGKQASVVEILGDSFVVDIKLDDDFETHLIDKNEITKVIR